MPAIFIRFAPVALDRKKTNSPPISKRAVVTLYLIVIINSAIRLKRVPTKGYILDIYPFVWSV